MEQGKVDIMMDGCRMPSQKAVWQNAENHGWHNPINPLTTDLLLIHSEVSEACDEARKGNLHYSENCNSVEEELADVIIRVLHVAEKNGFDMARTVWAKHRKNIDRPMRHGGKLF